MNETIAQTAPLLWASLWTLAAIALAAAATRICRSVAMRAGLYDEPNPLVPHHREPVAYLGGLGIALSVFTCTSFWFLWDNPGPDSQVLTLLTGTLGFLILGLLDDLVALRPFKKLILQLLAAGFAANLGFVAAWTDSYTLDCMLSITWIVAVVNAVNFTDVSDGLVAGLSIIALGAMAALLPQQATLILIAAGACGGFLWLNLPPAQIYLGDAGSHFLGSFLALLTITFLQSDGVWLRIPIALLVLGVFSFESVFITAARISKGLPWWKGSPDHFALRLQEAGFNRTQVNGLAWLAGLVLGITAVLINSISLNESVLPYVGLFMMTLFIWRFLWRLRTPNTERVLPVQPDAATRSQPPD